jgi:hypothetical protein
MSCKEVVTFWLDMGAPISLLSHLVAGVRPSMVASASMAAIKPVLLTGASDPPYGRLVGDVAERASWIDMIRTWADSS